MPALPPLALDTAHFGELRRNGQVYVDKTAYVQRMLEERMRYVFLARPRRFGKSLLVSTLAHLFGRENDDLFQGLAIAASGYLAQVPRVPALVLNMARVEGDTPAEVRDEMTRLVSELALSLGTEAATQVPPWGALDSLFAHLYRRHGKFAVLVDEYDAPLTSMLAKPAFTVPAQQETQGYLRAFYRTLKNWDEAMQFVFVTGILRVEGAGLFSALNNLRNLSDLASWNALCGFTESEIDRYLEPHLQQAAAYCQWPVPRLRARLRRHYNGYRFAVTGDPVYNPISYLTALSHLTQAEDAREIQATALPRPWLNLGQTQFLFQYMQAQGHTLRDIDFHAGGVRAPFDLHRPALNALLYQTGFLTLTRTADETVRLDFPNEEIEAALAEGMFYSYFGRIINQDNPEWTLVQAMAAALQERDCARALAAFDRILDRVSYQELEAESNYPIALHLVCAMCQSVLRVEAEAPGRRGRADIAIETRDTFYVFELKLNKSVSEALKQITSRGYLDKYAAEGKRIVGVGVNFIRPSVREENALHAPHYEWDALPGVGTQLTDQEKPALDAARV